MERFQHLSELYFKVTRLKLSYESHEQPSSWINFCQLENVAALARKHRHFTIGTPKLFLRLSHSLGSSHSTQPHAQAIRNVGGMEMRKEPVICRGHVK